MLHPEFPTTVHAFFTICVHLCQSVGQFSFFIVLIIFPCFHAHRSHRFIFRIYSFFIMHSPKPCTLSFLSVSIRVNLWANSHFSGKGLPSRLSENMPLRPVTGLGVLSDLEGNRFLKCWYWAATNALVPIMPESVKYRVR